MMMHTVRLIDRNKTVMHIQSPRNTCRQRAVLITRNVISRKGAAADMQRGSCRRPFPVLKGTERVTIRICASYGGKRERKSSHFNSNAGKKYEDYRRKYSHESPYTVLGLKQGALMEDVKRAFRQRAKEWHPDVCKGDEENEEGMTVAEIEQRFVRLQSAYELLSDEETKHVYDDQHRQHPYSASKVKSVHKNLYFLQYKTITQRLILFIIIFIQVLEKLSRKAEESVQPSRSWGDDTMECDAKPRNF